jgi:hypothetical protein
MSFTLFSHTASFSGLFILILAPDSTVKLAESHQQYPCHYLNAALP